MGTDDLVALAKDLESHRVERKASLSDKKKIEEANIPLTKQLGEPSQPPDGSYSLGSIRHYPGLMNVALDAGKPMFKRELTALAKNILERLGP